MAAYAPTPSFARRSRHPKTLLLIVGGHAALLAAVMSAKMDLPDKVIRTVTRVELIPIPKDPPPDPQPQPEPRSAPSRIDRVPVLVPVPMPDLARIEPLPRPLPLPDLGSVIRPDPGLSQPAVDPVRTGPRFATPAAKVRPPYPPGKLDRGEEAALRLRLTIDERGRVIAVEPVGETDRAFLEAARRHLIANWRYQPATEDGRPVSSSTVITLRFEVTDG